MRVVQEKVCSQCKDSNLYLSGLCRNCYLEYHRQYSERKYKENPSKWLERSAGYYKTQKGRFGRYKKDAKIRSISWNLTFEEFITFWQKPCFYTGRSIETIGLDRIDNNLGYCVENVVSCCKEVNRAKADMSQQDFLAMCGSIVKNLKLVQEK